MTVRRADLPGHLDLIAAAPDGIRKLRGLILELAVRGKLVPQDPNDEPASELLERIARERARLEANGTCRKSKATPVVSKDEQPFALPDGWEWARLDSIAPLPIADGDWIESKDQDINGRVRLIQLADVGVGEFKDKSARFVNDETFSRLNCTEIVTGDILVARLPNPIGRACIFPGLKQKAITVVDVAIVRPMKGTCSDYFVLAINARPFREQVESYGKGATRFRVSTGHLKTIALPVPPLAEQHRIVAKVDELMALCDRLEAEQADAGAAHARLVATLLGTLTQSADAAELAAHWQRVAEHFATLFTSESSLDALKQTILQLAVMGKLVPQDPNDEPASELLKRIAQERARLEAKGACKKILVSLPVAEGELPFSAPKEWTWRRLDELLAISGGVTLGRKLADRNAVSRPYLRVANVQRGKLLLDHMKSLEVPAVELAKYRLESGDLLITEGGDWDKVGRTAIWRGEIPECLHQNHVFRARPLSAEWCSRWTEMYLNSAPARAYFAASSKQTTNLASINMTQLKSCPFPVPPLPEQHRIVTKVDQLLALVDRLKADLAESRALQERLATTLIDSARQAA